MYKDLSLKEKAKVLQYGGKLGLTSVEDIAKLYDDAIGSRVIQDNNGYYAHPRYNKDGTTNDMLIKGDSTGTSITTQDIPFKIVAWDNLGNYQELEPNGEYYFPGSMVREHALSGHLAQEGKKFNKQRISDNEYFSIMEKVAEENNPKWNKDRKKRNQRQLSVDEELVRLLNSNDYDYRGYYTKYPNSKANADTHWTDEFKTVYHPTFSKESRYSGVIDRNYNPYGYIGGSWGNNDEFIPAPWQAGNQYQLGGEYNKYSIFNKWKEWVTKKQEKYNQMPIVNDMPITLPEIEVQSTKLGPISDYDNNTSELKYNYNTNTYDVNPIHKGLQKDAYTYIAELAPAMFAAGVPSIAYNTAMKVAQSGVASALAKQAIASEIGGKGVDLASRAITGNSFGKNVENVSNGVIPEWFGQYLNPGYFVNGQNVVEGVARSVAKRNVNTPVKEVVENVKPFELDMTQGYYPENIPGSITELAYFGMTPKEAYIQANKDLGKIGVGGKFMLDYNGAMSSDSYPMMLNMMRREKTPNFNITQSMLNGSPKMMRLNDFGRIDSDFGLMRKLNPNSEKTKELSGMMWKNVDRINKKIDVFNASRNMNIPHAYVPENDFMNGIYVPALQAERLYKQGSSIYIKPENRGKFTALKKRTGHSASWFKAHGTPAQKKMATFALNSRHWKHNNGGHLFQEDGQIFKRPQDDLTGRNILTSPILPPKSYYEQFTIPELEPKKPQSLQPLKGTYGNKYSELISMSDGTYINNPINKGLQQDWRTHALEFAPFLAIGAGPAIGSTATWLASKPALYNLGRMTLGSEIGGKSVDLASNLFTGNTWGQNVGNVVEGITGWNPNNTMVGQFVTDATNPGNYFDLSRLWKTGLATSPLVTRRNSIRQTNTQTNNSGNDFDIEDARNMFRSFEPDYTPSQSSGYRISQNETPRELLEDLENLIDHNIHGTYNRTDTPTIIHILEDIQNDANIHINPNILTTQAKFPSLTSRYRNFIENNQTFGPMLSRLKYTLNDYSRLKPNLRKGQIEDSGHILWGKLHKPQDGKDITGLAYFNMSPKNAVERAKRDMARIPVGSRFILDYAGATSHNSYPLSLHMMNSYVSPNFNVKPSKFFGLQRMIPLNDMGFATDDVLKSTNRNITRLNKDRGLKLPQAYLKNGTVFVPAVYAERMYDIGGYLNDLIPYYGW